MSRIARPNGFGPESKRGCLNLRQAGFTLIEILVTLVIVSFGLLGAAGLQMRMLAEDQEIFQRTQALLLLDDMQNRIALNRGNAASYVTATAVGTGGTACASAATLAERDLCEWAEILRGRNESLGTDRLGAMLGARGCIEQIDVAPLTLRITVVWQGMTPAAAPALACGEGLYGDDDSLRRAVSTRVAIGDLG